MVRGADAQHHVALELNQGDVPASPIHVAADVLVLLPKQDLVELL